MFHRLFLPYLDTTAPGHLAGQKLSPRSWVQQSKLRCRAALALTLGSCLLVGCTPPAPPPPTSAQSDDKQAVRPAKIIAQGQLLPGGGLIRLTATPGDTVERILVNIGEQVTAGQPLIELRSAVVRQSQLETLQQQLEDATLQQAAAVDRAQIELSAARMQLSQAEEQARSIIRREQSLPLLKQQWEDVRGALERAEALANDPLTRGMVSRLDIDKQRASVTASQLQYEQQQESLQLAQESAVWSKKLAAEKVSGAEKSLELAQKVDPTGVIRAQIKSAQQQLSAAQVTSPINGTVVSIDARVGENAAQLPLVQVADLTRMVCQVEIYQTDAPLVQVGQLSELRSDAFSRSLKGRVARIDRLIGYPQLRSTDPLAKVDYRTLPVLIEVAQEDSELAARWLQLQVEVTIPLETNAQPESKVASATSTAPTTNAATDESASEKKSAAGSEAGSQPVSGS